MPPKKKKALPRGTRQNTSAVKKIESAIAPKLTTYRARMLNEAMASLQKKKDQERMKNILAQKKKTQASAAKKIQSAADKKLQLRRKTAAAKKLQSAAKKRIAKRNSAIKKIKKGLGSKVRRLRENKAVNKIKASSIRATTRSRVNKAQQASKKIQKATKRAYQRVYGTRTVPRARYLSDMALREGSVPTVLMYEENVADMDDGFEPMMYLKVGPSQALRDNYGITNDIEFPVYQGLQGGVSTGSHRINQLPVASAYPIQTSPGGTQVVSMYSTPHPHSQWRSTVNRLEAESDKRYVNAGHLDRIRSKKKPSAMRKEAARGNSPEKLLKTVRSERAMRALAKSRGKSSPKIVRTVDHYDPAVHWEGPPDVERSATGFDDPNAPPPNIARRYDNSDWQLVQSAFFGPRLRRVRSKKR